MNRSLLKAAFLRSLPVMAGYVVLGCGFGILVTEAGLGPLWAAAMSLFIFAGSMQFVGISLGASPPLVSTPIRLTLIRIPPVKFLELHPNFNTQDRHCKVLARNFVELLKTS